MALCQYAYGMEKESRAPTTRDSDKYVVRLPEGMRDRIAMAAKQNSRTMNAEIVARLQASFDQASLGESYAEGMKYVMEAVEARKKVDAVNEFALFTLAANLRRAVEALPDDVRSELNFAGALKLADGIVHKDITKLFDYFEKIALQIGDKETASMLNKYKSESP